MKVESTWEPDWYQEQDKPGILALNQMEYGDVALSHEAYFDWLQNQNPMGSPIIPLAREKGTGKVVGFGMYVPMRVSWAGEARPALIGFNLVVAQAYRRQGIFRIIATVGPEEGKKRGYHFFYLFPNPRSLRGHRKWNDHIVSQIPLVIRPLDVASLTKAHVGNLFLKWGVNVGWKIGGATLWRERRPGQGSLPLNILEDTNFDDSYDRFWQQVKTKYDLMLVRDRAFLQWRFHDIPSRSYRALSVRQGTDILGYVILRQTEIMESSVGLIADFLVVPGEYGNQAGLYLLHEVLQQFKQAQLSLSGGLMLPHTQEYAIMRQAGYLRAPRWFAPQPFHLVIGDLAGGTPLNALIRPEGWYISIADHDAV